MGQSIPEAKGMLTLYLKMLLPVGSVYAAINQAWTQERHVVYQIECTLKEAEQIANTHRKLNGSSNVAADWDGAVQL